MLSIMFTRDKMKGIDILKDELFKSLSESINKIYNYQYYVISIFCNNIIPN